MKSITTGQTTPRRRLKNATRYGGISSCQFAIFVWLAQPKLTLRRESREGWRRGWDSHHCCVLQTKNLTDLRFLTIR
jgi:hypothetical protein